MNFTSLSICAVIFVSVNRWSSNQLQVIHCFHTSVRIFLCSLDFWFKFAGAVVTVELDFRNFVFLIKVSTGIKAIFFCSCML